MGDSMGIFMGIFMGYSSNRGRWVCRNFNLLIFGQERIGSMMKNHWILSTPSMFQQGELVLFFRNLRNCEEHSNLLPRQNGQFFLFNILVKLPAFQLGRFVQKSHGLRSQKKSLEMAISWGIPPTHGQTYQILSEYPHPCCLDIDQFKDSKTNQLSCEIQILDTSRWSNPWFSCQSFQQFTYGIINILGYIGIYR